MNDWQPIETAPRDGRLIDVKFEPKTAERDSKGSLAEFYAPGCTTGKAEPIIERVEFSHGHFRPVSGFGARLYACDMAVTLTHWRLYSPLSR